MNNAYEIYKQDPKAKDDLIKRFVTAGLETIGKTLRDWRGPHPHFTRDQGSPLVGGNPTGTHQPRGQGGPGINVLRGLQPDLIILYAEDSPKNIRYLGPKDLELAKIERSELKALACTNLQRLLPKIERHGTNGLYMITAGGDYEASLLLLDSIWSGGQMDIKGDIVVAIPTRDLLLVTGSRNAQGIEKVKQMVKEASTGGSYRLTQKLFVYRNGRFSEFTSAEPAGAANAAPPHR